MKKLLIVITAFFSTHFVLAQQEIAEPPCQFDDDDSLLIKFKQETLPEQINIFLDDDSHIVIIQKQRSKLSEYIQTLQYLKDNVNEAWMASSNGEIDSLVTNETLDSIRGITIGFTNFNENALQKKASELSFLLESYIDAIIEVNGRRSALEDSELKLDRIFHSSISKYFQDVTFQADRVYTVLYNEFTNLSKDGNYLILTENSKKLFDQQIDNIIALIQEKQGILDSAEKDSEIILSEIRKLVENEAKLIVHAIDAYLLLKCKATASVEEIPASLHQLRMTDQFRSITQNNLETFRSTIHDLQGATKSVKEISEEYQAQLDKAEEGLKVIKDNFLQEYNRLASLNNLDTAVFLYWDLDHRTLNAPQGFSEQFDDYSSKIRDVYDSIDSYSWYRLSIGVLNFEPGIGTNPQPEEFTRALSNIIRGNFRDQYIRAAFKAPFIEYLYSEGFSEEQRRQIYQFIAPKFYEDALNELPEIIDYRSAINEFDKIQEKLAEQFAQNLSKSREYTEGVAQIGSDIEREYLKINTDLANLENLADTKQEELIEVARRESEAFKELILKRNNYEEFFKTLNKYVATDFLKETDIEKYISLFNSKDQLAGLANQILSPDNLKNFVGDLEIFDLSNFGPVAEAEELWGQFKGVSNGIIGEGQNLMSSLGSLSELGMSGLGGGALSGAVSGMMISGKLSKMDKKLDAIIRELGVINQKLDKVLENQQIMISKLESIEAKVDSLLILNMKNHKKEMAVLRDIRRRIMDIQGVLDQYSRQEWLNCQKVVVEYEAINIGNNRNRYLEGFDRYFSYKDADDDCERCSRKLREFYFPSTTGDYGEFIISGDLNLLLYSDKYFYLDSLTYDNKLNKVKKLLNRFQILHNSNQFGSNTNYLTLLANPQISPSDDLHLSSNSISYSQNEEIINLENLEFLIKAVIYTRSFLLYKENYINGDKDRYLSIISEYRAFLKGLINIVNKALIQENVTTGHLLLSLDDKNDVIKYLFEIPEISDDDKVLLHNLGIALGYQRYVEEGLSRYKLAYYAKDDYIIDSLFFSNLYKLEGEGFDLSWDYNVQGRLAFNVKHIEQNRTLTIPIPPPPQVQEPRYELNQNIAKLIYLKDWILKERTNLEVPINTAIIDPLTLNEP